MSTNRVLLMGCGDIGPTHEPIEMYSPLVQPILATADLRFAQCERVYSERGTLHPIHGRGRSHSRAHPKMASIFSTCGLDVVSVASNHGLDWGEDALLDTIALFESKGIKTVGAGANLKAARRPAFVECNGVRIAFLGYCSVVQQGYAAGKDTAGIAPLRAHNYYEPLDYNAGVPPRVVTEPYAEDLDAMIRDIKAAKESAQVVVLSLHWGVHYLPRIVAQYQPTVFHAAVDAGVDLVLGHHPHVPKAIEVYKGKVCFYSLGNFMMTFERTAESAAKYFKDYGIRVEPEYPLLSYGPDGKRTLIAKAVLTPFGVEKVSFMPGLIDTRMRTEILKHGDARFDDMVSYMDWTSDGFEHKFTVSGDEVVVTG
jgi:poly-gamma-glutamate synthesis protein (capsule biosynthesis protein)